MRNGKNKVLSLKQRQFCNQYLINNGNGKEAAQKAGYSPKVAHTIACKNLKNQRVMKYMNKKLERIEEKFEMTFDWKIEKLKQIIELNVPGEANHHEDINATAAINAIAELNKMQGHYSAEKHINANIHADIEVEEIKSLVKKYERDY